MTEDDDTRSWPIGLRRLAEIVGAAAAARLAAEFGGTEDNVIPKKPNRRHPFVNVIGFDAFSALCAEMGPDRIDIPRGVFRDSRKAAILASEGSNKAVARRLNCSQRYVRRVRNTLDRPAAQRRLFEED